MPVILDTTFTWLEWRWAGVRGQLVGAAALGEGRCGLGRVLEVLDRQGQPHRVAREPLAELAGGAALGLFW